MAGPYNLKRRESLKASLVGLLSQLLEIPSKSVTVRVFAIGCIQAVLTIPFNSAERLLRLWRANPNVVKKAFLNPSGTEEPLELLAVAKTVGGKDWQITPEIISSWHKGKILYMYLKNWN